MRSTKKLKNILKYSSFVEIAINSNIIFAKANKKKSTSCCNITKEDDKKKKKEEENQKTIQTPVQNPNPQEDKKQNLINECNNLITQIKNIDPNYGKTVDGKDTVEKLTNFKTELENDLNTLNNKKSKEEKFNECKELEKEIKKINPDFQKQINSNENPENLDKIKNELEKELDFLDPNRKLRNNEKKPEEKQAEELKYFSDKLAMREILNKLCQFSEDIEKDKDSVKGAAVDECIQKLKGKVEQHEKKLDEIKKSIETGLTYENAKDILKETKEIEFDFENVSNLNHWMQSEIYYIADEEIREYFGEGRDVYSTLAGKCKFIYEKCNELIKKHDEEELKKRLEEEEYDKWLSRLSWSIPGGFECTSEGIGYTVLLKKDGVRYGRYTYDGFWLDNFDYYIKRGDLIDYIRDAEKLEFDDNNFKNDKILIAFDFKTINSINAPWIKILLDLKNKKIFVYENKKVYFVGRDHWMNLCKGDPYSAENDKENRYADNHSSYFGHIEGNKFNFRYRNNY